MFLSRESRPKFLPSPNFVFIRRLRVREASSDSRRHVLVSGQDRKTLSGEITVLWQICFAGPGRPFKWTNGKNELHGNLCTCALGNVADTLEFQLKPPRNLPPCGLQIPPVGQCYNEYESTSPGAQKVSPTYWVKYSIHYTRIIYGLTLWGCIYTFCCFKKGCLQMYMFV